LISFKVQSDVRITCHTANAVFVSILIAFLTSSLNVPAGTSNNLVIRVLYMEATGDEEIFFLKHALEEQTNIVVKALFYDQRGETRAARNEIVYVDQRNGDKVHRVQHTRHGYPKTLEQLLRYDVVICSDVARTAFTAEQMSNTVSFVATYGRGFAMIGGQTSFGSGYYDQTPLEQIIPVEMSASRDNVDRQFQVRIPTAAVDHPILKLDANAAENRNAWERLPPFLGFNRVDGPKPGAIVLWEHSTEQTAKGPSVILAIQEIGQGRTLAFTTDTTAKWGRAFEQEWGPDSRHYKQFWANAVRWLAAKRVAMPINK